MRNRSGEEQRRERYPNPDQFAGGQRYNSYDSGQGRYDEEDYDREPQRYQSERESGSFRPQSEYGRGGSRQSFGGQERDFSGSSGRYPGSGYPAGDSQDQYRYAWSQQDSQSGMGRGSGGGQFQPSQNYGSGSQRGGQQGFQNWGSEYGQQQQSGRFSGKGPKGYRRNDERIIEDISERLSQHPEVDASDIEVKVTEGTAVLTGTVPERRMKRMAEDVAEQCSGVNDVRNELRVKDSSQQQGNGGNTSSLNFGDQQKQQKEEEGARKRG